MQWHVLMFQRAKTKYASFHLSLFNVNNRNDVNSFVGCQGCVCVHWVFRRPIIWVVRVSLSKSKSEFLSHSTSTYQIAKKKKKKKKNQKNISANLNLCRLSFVFFFFFFFFFFLLLLLLFWRCILFTLYRPTNIQYKQNACSVIIELHLVVLIHILYCVWHI